ncbi:MAG: ABC-2 family transporter protein [Candidatus Doudnabacteria bacterium]|nr:ABC-2 family transporter protein [Candidatus Doudnabacteria bacterium]
MISLPQLRARLRAYYATFRIGLNQNIAYRARINVWTITHALGLLIYALVWGTVLGDQELAGFTQQDVLTYYLGFFVLERVVRAHGWTTMSTDIREGRLSFWLSRPIHYVRYTAMRETGAKVVLGLLVLPVLVLFLGVLVVSGTFTPPSGALDVALLLAFLIPGSALAFSISHIMGMVAFWLEDNKGPVSAFWALSVIFSGAAAPVALLPDSLQAIAAYLPFQYIAAFPMELYLGRVSGGQIAIGFAVAVSWAVILHLVSRLLWNRGIRRYSAVGG